MYASPSRIEAKVCRLPAVTFDNLDIALARGPGRSFPRQSHAWPANMAIVRHSARNLIHAINDEATLKVR
jgi:hypothetical protein